MKNRIIFGISDPNPQRVYDYDQNPLVGEERQHIAETAGRVSELRASLSVPML